MGPSFVNIPYDRPFLLIFSVAIGFGSYICVTLYTLLEEAVKLLWLVGVRTAHAVLVLLSSPTWRSRSSDLGTLHAALRCSTGQEPARACLLLSTNTAKLPSVWPHNYSAKP